MPLDVNQIRVGTCYRSRSGELRQVRAIVAEEVTYVVIFHALHRTSVGPHERMPLARFADEIERGEACP
ncbi:MAG: hypothetical protein AB7O88_04965 [Reyranellaceae bacterium]